MIYFESTPKQFNLKLKLGKNPSWQVLRSSRLNKFNDTAKKYMYF